MKLKYRVIYIVEAVSPVSYDYVHRSYWSRERWAIRAAKRLAKKYGKENVYVRQLAKSEWYWCSYDVNIWDMMPQK